MTSSTDFNKLLTGIRARLPIQNPLHSFVHNNILQMFENLDFHDAVKEAGELYRAKTYWPVEKYKECFAKKKISEVDIMEALNHYMGYNHELPFLPLLGITKKDFFYRLMFSELNFNDDEVQPELDDERLWMHCREKVRNENLVLSRSPVRWRAKAYWEKHHNILYSSSIHPLVTRLIGSYLDQGQSFWGNPFSQEGFWKFVAYDLEQTDNFLSGWQKVFAKKMKEGAGKDPGNIILNELKEMNIPEEKWESYLLDILFDLKGWAGMVNKLELEPWQATVKAPKIQLAEYLAVVLLIESSVDSYFSTTHSLDINLIRGRKEEIKLSGFQLSLGLYQIAKAMKLDERWVQKLKVSDALALIDGVDAAEAHHNIRLWHEAFEHHYHREAIQTLMSRKENEVKPPEMAAQVFFCIDDREESIRRHMEEVDPRLKTYGVVGFFGIDMKFSTYKHDRLIAQCPPVVVPSRIVTEVALDTERGSFLRRIYNFLGITDLAFYYQSRTMFRGLLTTLILGTLSVVPMFFQIFFPERARNMKSNIFGLFSSDLKTEILIEKTDAIHGYDVKEMAGIVKSVFDMCGIRHQFAPLIVLLAHGSSSNNNPFRQAYGCGACGGNAGIPNSRGFAKMANDPRVREVLTGMGLSIPENTVIISGFHDTCTDEISFFDLEKVSDEKKSMLNDISKSFTEALRRNALERCQRFSLTEAHTDADVAKDHVLERALDPAQPRPEYGHSKNALAIVAKRDLTKGLFLNRRAFLHSYDWELDPEGKTLASVVLGGVPVAVNINMDYYFSLVDNENFGCGSKLPLNLTALLGVMTGSQGDLRIGLARQMVEIHEPIRNMTIIEAPLERVQNLFESNKRLSNILHQHWMRLVVFDPTNGKWFQYGHRSWIELQSENLAVKTVKSSLEALTMVHTNDFLEIRS
ncbi:MAG: putative inorganic carbon transporter subunit DabA [Bdellovibrionota bacterium]